MPEEERPPATAATGGLAEGGVWPVARAFGERVKQLRAARTLRAFVTVLGEVRPGRHCSAGHLCEVEQGKACPSIHVVRAIDRACMTGGELEAAYPKLVAEWEGRKAQAERRGRQLRGRQRDQGDGQGQRRGRAGVPAVRRSSPAAHGDTGATNRAPDGYAVDHAASPGRGAPAEGRTAAGEDEANRRQALKAGVGALLGVAAARARDFLEWLESPGFGPLTLQGLDETAQRLTEDAQVKPVGELFAVAENRFVKVIGFIRSGHPDSSQLAQLESLAGKFAYLQGRFAFGLGDHAGARDHLRVAKHYGKLLDDHLLLASAAICESACAFYDGRLEEALALIQEGQQWVTDYTAARLFANEARIYGRMGPAFGREMRAALGRAEGSMPDRLVIEAGAESPFGPDLLAFYRSTALVWAEDAHAEQAAREAIREFELIRGGQGNYEDLALARLHLAAALAQRKNPDPREAARVAIQALSVPRALHTGAVRRRAREVLLLLAAKWPNLPAVKELAEVVRGYGPLKLPASARLALPGR